MTGCAADLIEDDEIECLACSDTGWIVAEYSDIRTPCPDCIAGWQVER